MRIISKKPLRDFWQCHPEAKVMLEDWFGRASNCNADSFMQLKRTFASADYVDGYTVFDVGGNRYRLIAAIHYDKQRLYVRHVLTHAEYDRNAWRKK
jgi:mRNA interferase HigB